MLKTCIDLGSYDKIDQMLEKLRRSAKEDLILIDEQNNLKDHDMKALENYFTQGHPDICLNLIDLNAFPKGAHICLVARKRWNLGKSK